MTILDTIIKHKRREIDERKSARPTAVLFRQLDGAPEPRDFRAALLDPARSAPRVIAEIKRRSPSKGPLRPDLDPAEIARVYSENGAAALSVLTDNHFFGGSLADLSAAREAVRLPVLCKEFVVDPYQIYEARVAGADAILLLASVLTGKELSEFRRVASSLGMASLVEVHNVHELRDALFSGAEILGINNRDLRTFSVTLDVTRTLIPLVPSGIVTVSESGIKSTSDRAELAALGVDALLVGEGLIAASDIASATREITGMVACSEASRR